MTAQQAIQRAAPSRIALQVFGEERLQILKDQFGRDLTDADLDVFALVCQRSKLDPFARPPQIYPIKRGGKLTIQAAIDSFRLAAARTREYQGQSTKQWCGPDGVWKDVWLSNDPPVAARVGVWRKGFREPIVSVATWRERAQYFNGKLGDFWDKMPAHMLAKVAEADALKRAFPNDTEGIELALIDEEIRQQAPANARRYTEIFGDEDHGTAYDLPQTVLNGGRVVDTGTGEVLQESAPTESDNSSGIRCTSCSRVVLDQNGQPINDNQRELLLQRFGAVICRDCRNL